MNLKSAPLTIISAITLITGVLLTPNIAQAASSSQTNKASLKQEHHATDTIPQLLVSKQAQKIEFIAFLSVISFSIVIPELFYKHKKPDRSLKFKESKEQIREEITNEINNIEQDISTLKVVTENTNTLILEKLNEGEKTDLKNQGEQDRKAA